MAYKKKFYNKKKSYGKKKFYKKKYFSRNLSSVASLANTAYNTANFIRGIVNTEYKVVDNDISMLVQNAAYTSAYLTGIAQGDDQNMRNGRSILAKSLYFQLRIYLGNTFNSSVARLVLVEDTVGDGIAPSASDLFTTVSGDNAVNSFRSILTQKTMRYKIWWDKRISLDQDFKNEIYISKYIKMYRHHVKYIGTGSASNNAGPGSFWLMCISTAAQATGVYPININGQVRMRYIDN